MSRNTSPTFGVEIECAIPMGGSALEKALAALNGAGIPTNTGWNYSQWSIVRDGGTNDNTYACEEIRTRILRGEEGLAELATGVRALKAIDAKAGFYCGMHVHVGRDGLSEQQLKDWRAMFTRYALCLDQIVAPWRWTNGYGSTSLISGELVRAKKPMKALREQPLVWGRCSTFAIRADKPTVEIRQHQSTLNARRAVEWVKLMLALRERAVNRPCLDGELVRGKSDASFRWFLMSLGLDKASRDYWMAERAAYAGGLNEDIPPGDRAYADTAIQRYRWAKEAA